MNSDFVKLSKQERVVLKLTKALTAAKEEWELSTAKGEKILKYGEYGAYLVLIVAYYNVHLLTLAFPPLDSAHGFKGKYLKGLMFPCTSYFSIPNKLTAYKMPRELLLSLSSGVGSLGGDVGVFPILWCLRKVITRLTDIMGSLFQEEPTRVTQQKVEKPTIEGGGGEASQRKKLSSKKEL
jgi:hypothetical protein